MKTIILLICCIAVTNSTIAQDFEKDKNYLSVGLGLDFFGYREIGNSLSGTSRRSSIGPIQLAYERGITDVLGVGRIGVGGVVTQAFYTQKYTNGADQTTYNRSRLGLMVCGAYHFEFDIPKMDVYAGIGIGLYLNSDKNKVPTGVVPGEHTTSRSIYVSGAQALFVGIRYYFTDTFGVYAETGYGPSIFNGGLVVRL